MTEGTRAARALSLILLAAGPGTAAQDEPAPAGDFLVPPGFRVERAAPLSRSLLALCFDDRGRLLAAPEDGGVLVLEDLDGDGFLETSRTLVDDVRACQGLAWRDGALFAVGLGPGDGSPVPGLYRVEEGRPPERLLAFDAYGEHGAHAVVPGPDGRLYVSVGDQATIVTPTSSAFLARGYEGALLEPYEDPGGFGVGARYPHGLVAVVDPAGREPWRRHAVGLRNVYDLAFDADGELFAVDSDMEWDVGLPWYRPVRLLHVVSGGDYGRRSGSAAWPEHYLDALPAAAHLGRGSPTGTVLYDGGRFPPELDGALLVGDWSRGRILALRPVRRGATFAAERPALAPPAGLSAEELEALASEGPAAVLVSARRPLNVTDLAVGPDGALYFTTGGRGTPGAVHRLTYGPVGSGAAPTDEPPPADAAGWRAAQELVERLAADPPPAGSPEIDAVALLLGDPDPRVRRRACEAIARTAFPVSWVREALEARLWDGERWVRFAARRALERTSVVPPGGDETGRAALERLALVARADLLRGSPSFLHPQAARLVAEARDVEQLLDALRVWQLAALVQPERPPEVAAASDARLLELAAHGDARVAREAEVLLAHFEVPGAVEALLARLEDAALPREERLHAADCLRAVEDGWSDAQRVRLLAWFEQAADWSGGGSFAGYVAAMLETCVERLDERAARALLASGTLGPRVLAALVVHGPPGARREAVEAMHAAWDALDELDEPLRTSAVRDDVLRLCAAEPVPELATWYRAVYDDEPRRRDRVLVALAELGDPADWELLVQGLSRGAADVPESCARALVAQPRRAEDGATIRAVLDAARRHDPGRGSALLAVLEHWTGRRPEPGEDWRTALDGWEAWFAQAYPGFRSPARRFDPPRWSPEAVAAFLERSAARPGSPARGARVYTRATCASCHVLGSIGADATSGLGPDLSDVARRFGRAELLEAIVYPSRYVSDLYRTSVAVTADGREREGRLLEDTARRVVLLAPDGRRVELAREDVRSLAPSERSLMPEGLLAELTLEEIKDLMAFLESGGRVEPADAEAPEWVPLLERARSGGWSGAGRPWRVEGDVVVGRSQGLEASRYLMTREAFGDFELELDVWAAPGSNGGLQYRSAPAPEGGVDPVGYQADVGQTYWGSLYATDGRGLLAAPRDRERRRAVDERGWNHLRVLVRGDRHVIEVNGEVLVDARDGEHARGALGFQLHQGGPMEVRYANARLRALD